MPRTLTRKSIALEFDYNGAGIDVQTRTELEEFGARIRKNNMTTFQLVVESGKLLAKARDALARHKDGVFLYWCEQETVLSRQTVYNYIRIAERFGHLDVETAGRFNLGALYELAKDTVPDECRNELIKQAKEGHRINHEYATSHIRSWTVDPSTAVVVLQEPCPNCRQSGYHNNDWLMNEQGDYYCFYCQHSYGEPIGDPDEEDEEDAEDADTARKEWQVADKGWKAVKNYLGRTLIKDLMPHALQIQEALNRRRPAEL